MITFVSTPQKKIWQHIFKKYGVFFEKIFLFADAALKEHADWIAIQNILITLCASICIVILNNMSYFSQIQIIFFTAEHIHSFVKSRGDKRSVTSDQRSRQIP